MTLSRGVAKPLTTLDEAASIYVLYRNSLRHFELHMHWILTAQGGEFILQLPSLTWKVRALCFQSDSHILLCIYNNDILLLLLMAILYKMETSVGIVETEIDAK